ncbi:hypothetical protein [Poseidonocella sp. HB161398]|uniref:hypothetical protein n=1 Tax=Poseidonocella sp. HB161398 TaxID=2320855 RepID=UPI001109E37F|nr:hypothetical protein [Poseidonocella sp. HB161398]
MEGGLLRRIDRPKGACGHVRIAGVSARHEPDEGELTCPAIFGAFDRAGLAAPLGSACHPRGRTGDGLGRALPCLQPPVTR